MMYTRSLRVFTAGANRRHAPTGYDMKRKIRGREMPSWSSPRSSTGRTSLHRYDHPLRYQSLPYVRYGCCVVREGSVASVPFRIPQMETLSAAWLSTCEP